jgi:DNA polymerase-3 subunit gamma/tau
MAMRSLSFDAALQSLAALLHRIAVLQFAPTAIADEVERARLQPYADGFDAEYLQLAYQMAIHGRDELPLAPDEQAGFTMTLLRLHAFRPESPPPLGSAGGGSGGGGAGRARPLPTVPTAPARTATASAAAAAPAQAPAAPVAAERAVAAIPPAPSALQAAVAPPVDAALAVAPRERESADIPPWENLPPEAFEGVPAVGAPAPQAEPAPLPGAAHMPAGSDDWHALVRALGLGGMVRELAQHCEWVGEQGGQIRLRLSNAHRHLLDMNPASVERLQDQLGAHFGRALRLHIDVGAIADATPAQRDQAEKQARHEQAVAALEADPFVRELIERFDATLLETSVRPL